MFAGNHVFNQFVSKADEKGISVFEDQYGIVPEYGDSLELRRQRVLTRTLTPQPLTIRRLKQIFESLKIPAEVSVDQDHLHIRGEYGDTMDLGNHLVGSPPHTWRIRWASYGRLKGNRITSTYVENTG